MLIVGLFLLSNCVKENMIKEGRKTEQTENENDFLKLYLWHSDGKGNGGRDGGKVDAARIICSPDLSLGICFFVAWIAFTTVTNSTEAHS